MALAATGPLIFEEVQLLADCFAPYSQRNDLGVTTGNYIDASGVNHGFLRGPFGNITTFNVSAAGTGSGQGTVPEGIDLVGDITGQYIDSNNVNHGFVRNPFGAIITFDAPQAGTAAGTGDPSGDAQSVWGDHRTIY